MQMLQQFFGEQGARYATFLITLVVLLIVILLVWWMIRKALGDRLNMTDKPDRRGRPPRLGITESFTVDRQGRRLVMVRRDNVEHLIMIGGPNDFVVETNVVRGERPVVGRQDQRAADSDLIPVISLSPPEPAQKVLEVPRAVEPARQVAPVEQRTAFAPLPPVMPKTPPVATSQPVVVSQPLVSSVKAVANEKPIEVQVPAVQVPAVQVPAVQVPTIQVAKPIIPDAVALPPALVEQPAPAKPSLSLAERIKASLPGLSQKSDGPKPEPIKLPDVPKLDAIKIDVPKFEAPKIEVPQIEPLTVQKSPVVDNMKSRLEDILKPAPKPLSAPPIFAPTMPPPVVPPPAPVADKPTMPQLPIQVPPPVVAPPAVVAPSVSVAAPPVVAAQPAAPAKLVSKNPFDSLEEEMAKLLGRVPDGKS